MHMESDLRQENLWDCRKKQPRCSLQPVQAGWHSKLSRQVGGFYCGFFSKTRTKKKLEQRGKKMQFRPVFSPFFFSCPLLEESSQKKVEKSGAFSKKKEGTGSVPPAAHPDCTVVVQASGASWEQLTCLDTSKAAKPWPNELQSELRRFPSTYKCKSLKMVSSLWAYTSI